MKKLLIRSAGLCLAGLLSVAMTADADAFAQSRNAQQDRASVGSGKAVSAPEMDPSMLAAGVAIVVGGALVLLSWRRSSRTASSAES
jgi:hypothetical protein